MGMRCGKAADAVVANCAGVSTHSAAADVAQNQPNIVSIVAGTEVERNG